MLHKIGAALVALSVLFLGIPQVALAQSPCTLQLSGKVVNAETGESLPFAGMYLREADIPTTTEEDGTFVFKNLCPDSSYHLEVHFLGHEEFHTNYVLNSDRNVLIKLSPKDKVLEEVEVVGQRVEEHTLEQATRLSATQLRATRNQSLGKALESVGGVRTLQSGPNVFKPVIHGLHSNRILIYQNDIRLEGQQWGTEHAPEIDPFQAERIAVLKGAPAVRYGAEAIGGVIVIDPPALPTEAGWSGEINTSAASNGGMATVSGQLARGTAQLPGFGWRLQGTLKRAGDFSAPRYGLPNTGLMESSVSGAIGMKRENWQAEVFASHYHSENGILRSAHIGNLTDLEAALAADTPFFVQPFTYEIDNPKQQIDHTLMKVDIELPQTELGGWDIIYGLQRNARLEFDRRRGDRANTPAMDMQLLTNTLDVHYHHPYLDRWKGTAGITGLMKVNENQPGTGVSPLIPAYSLFRGSFFAMEQFLTDTWELEAGFRYDAQQQTIYRLSGDNLITPRYFFHNVSATVGGLYKFSEELSLRSILATAWRPPDVSEQYSEGLHHGAAALEVGDTTLVPEQAYKWLNTLTWTGERARITLDAYAQQIDNYIYLSPTGETVLTIRGAFPLFRYTQTNARLLGFDLSTQAQLPWQTTWSGQYSVIRASDLTAGGYLYLIPADRVFNRLQWQSGEDRLWQWKVWAEHVYVARQTRVIQELDFMDAPPAYHLWNGGLGLTQMQGNKGWEILLQVQNALNTEYRDYMNRYRYFAAETGRNIQLSLHYSF